MNAFTKARHAIDELLSALHMTARARMAASTRVRPVVPPPRATQLLITGNAMVRVVDADTGKVLGFRETIREARWLQAQLERGESPQGAA